MREIKFRGFDKRDKKIKCISDINFDGQGKVYSVRFAFEDEYTLIDDVELMQYIGLKDKNGVEIYEGDIVRCVDYCKDEENKTINENLKVVWIDEYVCFVLKGIKTGALYRMSIFNDYEVVGNIFENPELLEQAE